MSRYLMILMGMVCLAATLANAAESGAHESSTASSSREEIADNSVNLVTDVDEKDSKELLKLFEEMTKALRGTQQNVGELNP